MAVLLYLAPHHKASRSARGVASCLKLDFTVDESAEAAGPVEQISESQSLPLVSLPCPPPMPTTVALMAMQFYFNFVRPDDGAAETVSR